MMRYLNIFVILIMLFAIAAPLAGQQAGAIEADPGAGHVECHCAMGEHMQGDHPYMIDCGTADKTTQKFHNQYKNILLSKQILSDTGLAVIIYPKADYSVSEHTESVELPPPRLPA